MYTLIRLSLRLIRRRWGMMVVGAIVALIGLVTGLTSHPVTYQTISQGTFTPHIVSDGNDYLQLNNGSIFYIIHESDFSPTFNGVQIFSAQGISLELVADTNSTDVSFTSIEGAQVSGTGYQVEKITILDSNGQNPQIYQTSQYQQNPNGYYDNNWGMGAIFLLAGLAMLGIGIFVMKPKQQVQSAYSITPPPTVAGSGTANPYDQPYQSPTQYPGATPASPYPPSNSPYSAPNPYTPYPNVQPAQQSPYPPSDNPYSSPYNQ